MENGDEVELERWSEKGKEAVVELEERDKEERKEGGIGGGGLEKSEVKGLLCNFV